MSKEGSQIIPNIDGEKQDVDIIGIHGLDMNSPDAWTWRDDYGDFLWLSNSGILKERIGKAGVFIFDWPTVLIQHLSKTTKPIEQIAQFLLASIQTGRTGRENRPILFIAWGLGGIILMQVLCMAKGEYVDIQRATRGIIFLSTPFKEEGFQNVTTWTGPGLKTWSLAEDQEVDRVLENVVQSTSLKDLVPEFTTLCERYHYHVSTFYETNNIEYLCDLYGSLPKLRYSTKIVSLSHVHRIGHC